VSDHLTLSVRLMVEVEVLERLAGGEAGGADAGDGVVHSVSIEHPLLNRHVDVGTTVMR